MPSVEHREAKTYLEVLKKPADSNPICLPGNLICLVVKNTKMPEGWKNSTEKSKPASTEHSELKLQKKSIFKSTKSNFLTFSKVQKHIFC